MGAFAGFFTGGVPVFAGLSALAAAGFAGAFAGCFGADGTLLAGALGGAFFGSSLSIMEIFCIPAGGQVSTSHFLMKLSKQSKALKSSNNERAPHSAILYSLRTGSNGGHTKIVVTRSGRRSSYGKCPPQVSRRARRTLELVLLFLEIADGGRHDSSSNNEIQPKDVRREERTEEKDGN